MLHCCNLTKTFSFSHDMFCSVCMGGNVFQGVRAHNALPSGVAGICTEGKNFQAVHQNPTQTRVVLWVKACSYPNPQLSLGTGLSPVVGSTGEEESGIPHSVHGNCFLLVVCSTSLPWGAPAVHLPSHWGFHNWSNVGKILQAMSHTHVLTHSPAAQIRL